MNIKDLSQTAIFCGMMLIIPVFAFSFYLYCYFGVTGKELVEKSFTAANGSFGGIATLTAAYIASKLVVNWKDQTKHNEQLILRRQMVDEAMTLLTNIGKIRTDRNLALHLCKILEYISIPHEVQDVDEKLLNEIKVVASNYINSSSLEQNLIQLRNIYLQLKLYEDDHIEQNCHLLTSIVQLESEVAYFRTKLSSLYTNQNTKSIRGDKNAIQTWKTNAAYVSQYVYTIIKDNEPDIQQKSEELVSKLQNRITLLIECIHSYVSRD